ncbi:hypothetical protein [Cupriavidus basilensis]|uniref:Putative phage tail protein n=1 Tax=Cupriavidus basilensis TaxID=68895 RepID=A0A0C4YE72_9BURK|nr:hypothetical protein [Cupriavidus basilensis]AJG19081.1 Putative phage tail protein [Cupriavidus basilensis]
MIDVYHYYGSDLSASPSGDLMLADRPTTGTQRVYRRLLTNPQLSNAAGQPIASADYTWHPTYGAGLPRKVGLPGDLGATKALIRGQMLLESAVARQPRPNVNLTDFGDGISAAIKYTDTNTAAVQSVTFDINK